MNEMEIFLIYEKETEKIQAGKDVLYKHRLIGYWLDGETILTIEEENEAIFVLGNRVTVLMRAMM